MSDILIKPRHKEARAVRFDGNFNNEALKNILEDNELTIEPMPNQLAAGFILDRDGFCTTGLFNGEFLVSYGPFWDVMSAEDFHAHFEFEIE